MVTTRPLPRGYEFVRDLGAGAFGDVVLARQHSLDRMVAIKRIHQFALTDPDAIVRFRREAQVLAALNDPAIVRVYDFVTTDTDALLVMEFVDGMPFDDVLERRAPPTEQVLRVLTDVARALTTAGRAGVAHRDVKPANVFVLNSGGAKLGDFGLARVVSDPGVFRTIDGRASGTPAYFPPEVSQGAEPDARSDAYSFAVMAYEALTGRRPIRADDPMSMIAAHWNQTAPRPEAFLPGFPSAASDALLQGLDKRPERRLMPGELVDRLRAVPAAAWPAVVRNTDVLETGAGHGHAGTTRVLPVPTQSAIPSVLRPRRRRNRRAVIVSGVVLVVACAAAVTSVLIGRSTRTTPHFAVVSAVVTVTPTDGRGRCPQARFDFVARVTTNGQPGTLVATWTLPGNRHPTAQRIVVRQGQRDVSVGAHFSVSGERPLDGRAQLRVGATTALSPEIHYEC